MKRPRLDFWFPWLAAGGALAAFLPALRCGFAWDDQANLIANGGYRALDVVHWRWMFTTFFMGPYQPLSWLSLALDYRFWGLDPFGFHLTNLVLHAANAALFYWVSCALVTNRRAALLAAVIFAAHPLRAESVVWITERRDVLSGAFFLTAILAYVKSVQKGRKPWLAVVCHSLALGAKVSAVGLPAALIALDVYPLKRRLNRAVWIEKTPFLTLSLVFAVVAVAAQVSVGNLVSWGEAGFGARLLQAVFQLGFYVQKTTLPLELSPLYDVRSFGLSAAIVSALILACVEGGLRAAGVERKARAALWIYYIAMVAPILGALRNGPQAAADRYTYLPCLGWALVMGAGLEKLRGALPRRANWAPEAAVAAALVVFSWHQTSFWRDDLSLWTRAVAVDPGSALAWSNQAAAFCARHRWVEGEASAREAIALRPEDGVAHVRLALALWGEGRLREAEPELRLGVKMAPSPEGWDYIRKFEALNAGKERGAKTKVVQSTVLAPQTRR